jgi:hypothetical protein
MLLLFDVFFSKTSMQMYLQKVIGKKIMKKNLFFVGILSATDEKTGFGSVTVSQ